MTSIHCARIIRYEKICGLLPGSKQKMSVTKTIKKNGGKALGIVHPLWCENLWYKKSPLNENYDTVAPVSRVTYNSYLDRLKRRVSKENGVIFLFAISERSAVNWVRRLHTNASFILIETAKRSPVPRFPEHVTRALRWKTLAFNLKNLGVTKLKLAGETDLQRLPIVCEDYKTMERASGCINIAYDSLKSFLTVDKVKSLTFPNVYLDSCGNVLSEW